ncbi:MAG: recombinase RecT, partial [Mycobacterium sp.]
MSRTTDALAIRSEQIARVDEGQPEYSWEKRLLKYQADFQLAMPAGDANQLIRDALNCFRTTPRLLECEQATILGGLMTCAQLNLRPGVNGLGQAWLVPFRNGKASRRLEREVYEAQLIIG